jgi:hypothetical protein
MKARHVIYKYILCCFFNYRIAEGVKAVIGVGILLTYGLQLNVTADLVWKGIFKKLVIRIGKIDSIQAERFYPVMRILLILGTSKH